MRDTSIAALEWCEKRGITSKNEQHLLVTLAKMGSPATRSELAYASKLRINCVTRPIRELLDRGILEEHEPRPDKHSGRMAHPVWFPSKRWPLLRLIAKPEQGTLL